MARTTPAQKPRGAASRMRFGRDRGVLPEIMRGGRFYRPRRVLAALPLRGVGPPRRASRWKRARSRPQVAQKGSPGSAGAEQPSLRAAGRGDDSVSAFMRFSPFPRSTPGSQVVQDLAARSARGSPRRSPPDPSRRATASSARRRWRAWSSPPPAGRAPAKTPRRMPSSTIPPSISRQPGVETLVDLAERLAPRRQAAEVDEGAEEGAVLRRRREDQRDQRPDLRDGILLARRRPRASGRGSSRSASRRARGRGLPSSRSSRG